MTDKTEGQRSPDHPYNAPGLCPLQFLQAVYHDPTVDIGLRILAAYNAAPYVAPRQGLKWEHRDPMDRLTIVIEGLGSNSVSVSSGQEPQINAPGQTDHGHGDTIQ